MTSPAGSPTSTPPKSSTPVRIPSAATIRAVQIAMQPNTRPRPRIGTNGRLPDVECSSRVQQLALDTALPSQIDHLVERGARRLVQRG